MPSPDLPGTGATVHAAGGVLWRHGASGEIEVVGVYRPGNDNWSLPKGKLEPGEHRLAGACREVVEETGLAPVPQTFLTRAGYLLSRPGGDITKIVDFWSMRTRRPQAPFVPTEEVTEQRWIPLSEVDDILTRPRDRQALAAFRAMPEVTATVVLVRHADAEPMCRDGDSARALNAAGCARAEKLAGLLELYRPQQVITAPIKRCTMTVAPLAAAMNIVAQRDARFCEDDHLGDPERTVQRLRELADTHTGVVVCSQAPVITDTVALLADTDAIEVPDVSTPVGGVWVLSFAHKTLVAAERL